MTNSEDVIIGRLEELGEDQVSHLLSIGGLPASWNMTATAWLSKEDMPARENEANEAMAHEDFASGAAASAQKAAWFSAFASIAAAMLALTDIIVTLYR